MSEHHIDAIQGHASMQRTITRLTQRVEALRASARYHAHLREENRLLRQAVHALLEPEHVKAARRDLAEADKLMQSFEKGMR